MEILAKLIVLVALVSCASADKSILPKVDPEVVYKKDMAIEFNGQTFIGLAVLPAQPSYDFHVIAAGEMDLFTFTNCHREEVSENAGNVSVTKRSFIFKKTTTKKNELNMTFTPTPLENANCPVFMAGYEKDQGRHSWAFIDFENGNDKLDAKLACNGQDKAFKGVSVCQSKVGLVQRISFPGKVKVSPDAGCEFGDKPGIMSGESFDFSIRKGQCVYVFMDANAQTHKLTTFGYEQVLIRK